MRKNFGLNRSFSMSATDFLFHAPDGALSQLGVRTGGSLVSYFRSLPWSFIKSAVVESADFDYLSFLKRILAALTTAFDDVFDEVSSATIRATAISVLRSIYKTPSAGDRDSDGIIGDCVRAWTARSSDHEGAVDVAYALDIVFII